MQQNIRIFEEGDIVKIRTNKCNIHLMEMFGHCQFKPEEISADEYIARIKSVIENGEWYSVVIFAPHGECCHVIEKEEILCLANADDLKKIKLDNIECCNLVDSICYVVSDEEAMHIELSKNAKRLSMVIAAVGKLHPNEMIRVIEISPTQSFLRLALYNKLDKAIKECVLSAEQLKLLKEKKDNLIRWAETLHFEEHYEYHVGVDKTNNKVHKEPDLSYYIVAVNENGSKAYVMETRNDRNIFFDYLGPDFKNLYIEIEHLLSQCQKNK